MPNYSLEEAKKKLAYFDLFGQVQSIERYGCGHINDTFLVVTRKPTSTRDRRYILQRISPVAFHEPEKVMANIAGVTEFLKGIILARGGNPDRETLIIIPTKDGKNYMMDEDNGCWRMYIFIEDTLTYQLADSVEVMREAGKAFGQMHRDLLEYPAATLNETIPNFHHTVQRFANLEAAIARDAAGRAKDVQAEIDFALSRKPRTSLLLDGLARGELPLRVTHNDTKINNVLMDQEDGHGLCVVDLDTVMPGLVAYDFGDAIRFGANTAAEDESDLSKVRFSMDMYKGYSEGYLGSAGDLLTPAEIRSLPLGAWMMTYEVGIRFLTDYLDGDVYFHTAYPEHNLVRARNQFALLKDMEQQEPEMLAFVEQWINKD